jgi:hypothetical protein
MTFDEGSVARSLAASIEIRQHQIRTGEELRSVVFRPASTGTLAPETAASRDAG